MAEIDTVKAHQVQPAVAVDIAVGRARWVASGVRVNVGGILDVLAKESIAAVEGEALVAANPNEKSGEVWGCWDRRGSERVDPQEVST